MTEHTRSGMAPRLDRRGMLRLSAALGASIPFWRNLPAGFVPAAFAQGEALPGKDGLTLLGDRPVNAETPPHLLDDSVTPTNRHFVRNNGLLPDTTEAEGWVLTVDGLVDSPMELSIADLRERFEVVSQPLVLECAGNGRAFFDPPATGNQWTWGAVGCSEWTGVRLSDVLSAAGVRPEAIYTAHEGADIHLSGDPDRDTISRGVPIGKAMDGTALIAFEQNGAPIHPLNGAPLRLVIPGYPGSASQKWLTRIWLRDQVHDGEKMTGQSYRVPNRPVAPGEEVADEDFVIIEEMPVKSLITFPESGTEVGRDVEVRGHAWAGTRRIDRMDVTTDFGSTWTPAELDPAPNAGAWHDWRARLTLPEPGYYEVWARATDETGVSQPFAIDWNPRGYISNVMHRIALFAA